VSYTAAEETSDAVMAQHITYQYGLTDYQCLGVTASYIEGPAGQTALLDIDFLLWYVHEVVPAEFAT